MSFKCWGEGNPYKPQKYEKEMGNEINEETNNGKLVSKNFMILTLASISLRAYRGFHDAMEIPLPGQLKNYLIFAPPIINGLLGICDGVSIAKTGKQFTGNYLDSMEGEFKEMVEEPDLPFNKYLYGKFSINGRVSINNWWRCYHTSYSVIKRAI